jgi:hypothetical protein
MYYPNGVFDSTERACNLISVALILELANGEQRICVMEEDLRMARAYISSEIAHFEISAFTQSNLQDPFLRMIEDSVKSLKMLRSLGIFVDKILEARGKDRFELALELNTLCSECRAAAKCLSGRFDTPAMDIQKPAPAIRNDNPVKRPPARCNRNLN